MNEFVVIAGLSGAGRSQAADILEDMGWFVIDNLPPALIPKVSELAEVEGSSIAKVVLVVGTGPYHDEVLPALHALRAQIRRLRVVFLEASTDVLVLALSVAATFAGAVGTYLTKSISLPELCPTYTSPSRRISSRNTTFSRRRPMSRTLLEHRIRRIPKSTA